MPILQNVNQTPPTRQEQLDAWLKSKRSSYAALGRLLGVSRSGAVALFKADRVSVARKNQMTRIRVKGEEIPSALLPVGEDVKRGPKPCTDISLAEA